MTLVIHLKKKERENVVREKRILRMFVRNDKFGFEYADFHVVRIHPNGELT